jgi:hypothetical protein
MADLAAGIAWSVPQENQRGLLHSGMGLGASSRPGKADLARARAAIRAAHTTAFDRATLRACASASGRDASYESAMNGWSWPRPSVHAAALPLTFAGDGARAKVSHPVVR